MSAPTHNGRRRRDPQPVDDALELGGLEGEPEETDDDRGPSCIDCHALFFEGGAGGRCDECAEAHEAEEAF